MNRATWTAASALSLAAAAAGAGLSGVASATPRAADAVLTMHAGGDRSGVNGATVLGGPAGVVFTVRNAAGTVLGSCPTVAGGTCTVSVPTLTTSQTYTVTQSPAPPDPSSGWFTSPALGVGGTAVAAANYSQVNVTVPANATAASVPPAGTNSNTNDTFRSGTWALSRDNPPEPAVCGLNVAVLFDLSNSVEPYLSQYLAAGVGFVRALEDTPSHVALYTFASSAPANTTYNANVPLTSVQTALDAAPLITRIQGFRADLGQDGGTNWDRGIWQIAANPQHYDVAVVLTDGNPTFYTYTVTNPAGQFFTLDNVTVTDNKIHGPIHCAATTLAPGESTTCTAVYAIRQSDLDAGHVTNLAPATGTATNGTPVLSDDVTTTVRAHQRPAISIVKTASVHSFDAAGLLITYFYRVTNTGNVSLLVTTGDDNAARPVCPRPVLPPGRSITCRSYHIVSEADVAAGHIPNVGFTTGQAPDGSEVHADDLLNIPEVHAPTISIVKIPSVFSFAAAGVPVTYFYLVTNSGNVTLDPVRVTDSRGLPVSCPRASLAPGELMTCTAHYVTTQTDVDRGSIPNTGTVTGTAPDGAEVTDHSSVAIPAVPAPAISIVKTASPVIFSAAGQVITYSYLVTNNGTVSLHGATVTDSRGLALSCPSTSLAVGQAMTCTARYRITQADLSAGPIINIALVQGTAPDGSVLVDGSLAFVFPTVFFFPVTG